jgi:hypothetical protein
MLVLFAALSAGVAASAQTAVDMSSEPHHRLLLNNGQIRVFQVTLRPSERYFVRHEHNFLVVTLQDCEMVMWAEGQSEVLNFRFNQGDARFFFGGPPRGARNDRTETYRNITVEFLSDKVTTYGYQPSLGSWQYGSSVINPPVDPTKAFHNTLRLGEAVASDVQLLPKDILPPPGKGTSELLIPTSNLNFITQSDLHARKSVGDVWELGTDRKYDLLNADPSPARFVLVEIAPKQN